MGAGSDTGSQHLGEERNPGGIGGRGSRESFEEEIVVRQFGTGEQGEEEG